MDTTNNSSLPLSSSSLSLEYTLPDVITVDYFLTNDDIPGFYKGSPIKRWYDHKGYSFQAENRAEAIEKIPKLLREKKKRERIKRVKKVKRMH